MPWGSQRRHWMNERNRKILTLKSEGIRTMEIAERFGLSEGAVSNILKSCSMASSNDKKDTKDTTEKTQ